MVQVRARHGWRNANYRGTRALVVVGKKRHAGVASIALLRESFDSSLALAYDVSVAPWCGTLKGKP